MFTHYIYSIDIQKHIQIDRYTYIYIYKHVRACICTPWKQDIYLHVGYEVATPATSQAAVHQ